MKHLIPTPGGDHIDDVPKVEMTVTDARAKVLLGYYPPVFILAGDVPDDAPAPEEPVAVAEDSNSS
jgi:hypothetical protein